MCACMPAALLDMSRAVLAERFSSPVLPRQRWFRMGLAGTFSEWMSNCWWQGIDLGTLSKERFMFSSDYSVHIFLEASKIEHNNKTRQTKDLLKLQTKSTNQHFLSNHGRAKRKSLKTRVFGEHFFHHFYPSFTGIFDPPSHFEKISPSIHLPGQCSPWSSSDR